MQMQKSSWKSPRHRLQKKLKLVADPSLYERYKELAFNAGLRDHSIIINTEDYKRIVHPELIDFLKEVQPNT